ncbi:hypothetical protein KEM55_005386 [Ascosphaera atra]|nr:hypothetical protein KEM55_005386 [Ascosphaera atra]
MPRTSRKSVRPSSDASGPSRSAPEPSKQGKINFPIVIDDAEEEKREVVTTQARTRQPQASSRPTQRHRRVTQAPPAQSRPAGEVECVGDADVMTPEPWEIFGADLFESEEGIVPLVYGKRVYLGTPELPQRARVFGGPERREDVVKKWNAKRKADAEQPSRSADELKIFKFIDENI